MTHFARRKDASHSGIVAAFRFAGCSWLNIEASEKGAPDGLVGCSGKTLLVEIKPTRETTKDKRQLERRPSQLEWAAKWRGSPVHVVTTPAEAWALAELVRMTHVRKP